MSTVVFPLVALLACDRARGLNPPAHWYMPEVEFLPAPEPVLRADRCHVDGVLAFSRAYFATPVATAEPGRLRRLLSLLGWSVGFALSIVVWGGLCFAFGASLQIAAR